MSVRYLCSGGVMLAGALFAGAHLPRGRELWLTAFYGILTIGVGTGSLSFAEQWVPSGLAALMVTITPFWMVGVESLTRGGDRLHGPTIAGMLVGVAGVALLLAPGAGFTGASVPAGQAGLLSGFLLLQVGAVGWSAGAIGQRKLGARAHPIVSGAVQQMTTGLVYVIPALFQQQTVRWTTRGVWAVGYLVVFGGIVGYSSFVFAMDRLPVAIASIYSYVNPMVAVALGWLFYREPFGVREAMATAIIFIGVTIVKRTASSVAVKKLSTDGPAESG